MNSHYNRLPPDLYKCGGSFSLGHSLQTMVMTKRENENSEGQTLRKLHFQAIFLLFLKVFPFFNTENRQRMFATRAVGWTTGLPTAQTGLTRFTGLRDRMRDSAFVFAPHLLRIFALFANIQQLSRIK